MKRHEAGQSTGCIGENHSVDVKRFRESQSEAVRRPGHDIPGINTKFRGALGESRNVVALSANAQFTHSAAECDGDSEFLLRPLVHQSLQQIDSKQRGCDCVPSIVVKTRERGFR